MRLAADALAQFCAGKTFEDYARDLMFRSAVERQFEIIGEALSRMSRLEPDVAAQISEYRRIIAFRNILIHGYAAVDDRVVWSILETRLPLLRQEVAALLESEDTST